MNKHSKRKGRLNNGQTARKYWGMQSNLHILEVSSPPLYMIFHAKILHRASDQYLCCDKLSCPLWKMDWLDVAFDNFVVLFDGMLVLSFLVVMNAVLMTFRWQWKSWVSGFSTLHFLDFHKTTTCSWTCCYCCDGIHPFFNISMTMSQHSWQTGILIDVLHSHSLSLS